MARTVRLRADNLARVRLQRGLTADVDLAAQAGINRTTLYRLIKGDRGPTKHTIAALCDALDVPYDELFEVGEEDTKRGAA